ncbi:efflux transporter outer membrane subunit [Paraburkholderia sp. SOS3]|jgi:multidrug efflux system outer membrane protein|uniref:efflux transporter outer membrane subunit n=1 Tax=Paraburkholderia sp. SOS3 TaxID=1926494 RepID=UPI0009FAF41D|nr:efflux transporter outer membrane subunit [Paraburkholderia sp. SOS3]
MKTLPENRALKSAASKSATPQGAPLKRPALLAALVAAAFAATACSLAPKYQVPDAQVAPAYKETAADFTQTAIRVPTDGTWKTAQPSEAIARGQWWTVFDDPTLDSLEQQAHDANQDLKAAVARVKEARALNEVARAGFFPTINAGFGPTRQQISAVSFLQPDGTHIPEQTIWRAQASASYEVDLFGRVDSNYNATKADAQQTEALLHSVLLALQADVAQNYFSLRELDGETAVLANAVDLRVQALGLVQHRFDDGEISELDVARAKAELESTRSDLLTVQRLRASSEHSLAVLLGKTPSEFTMAANPLSPVEIRIPPGLPSALLERRPDVAAAERAMAAANARIGIARAAYFPSLELTGNAGFEAATIGNLFRASSWAFLAGPAAGTALTQTIFDGGRRKGNLKNAHAQFEEQVANYREQVLVAFQQVEDNLSDLRILEDQTQTQGRAVAASSRAAHLSRVQYNEGAVNYLDVIDAERTVLDARRVDVQLRGVQAESTVALIRALGGGWGDTIPKPPEEPSLAKQ